MFANLRKGLARLGVDLATGMVPRGRGHFWIHDDWTALYDVNRFRGEVLLGPNLTVLPQYLPRGLRKGRFKYLMPSHWSSCMWAMAGFPSDRLRIWSVGIDGDEFTPRDCSMAEEVLVYFKPRFEFELRHARDALERSGLRYSIIRYGSYSEEDFKRRLSRTKWCLWIGRPETQGIALQEVLACNVPVLVWDAKTMFFNEPLPCGFPSGYAFLPATSAPLFSSAAGVRISCASELLPGIRQIEDTWRLLGPRQYVLEELSLERSARTFLAAFDNDDVEKSMTPSHRERFRPSFQSRLRFMLRRARNRFGARETRVPTIR